MLNINLDFLNETYDENGLIKDYKFIYPDNFNFAYDVIDKIAADEPDRCALLWCDDKGNERRFSYSQLALYSRKTANYFRSLGIGKGDMVMLVLRRHYQFWFSMLALHRLGAVAVPATYMLTRHDVVYRANAADIRAIICTGMGDTAEHVDAAMSECPTVKNLIMVNGKRDGWLDFDEGVEAADDKFERVETNYNDTMLVYFSSGTTGNPKMAAHAYTYALGHLATAKYWHNLRPGELHLTIADTGWGKAVWGKFYGQFFMESTVMVYDYADRFSADDMLKILEKYKVTSFCAPPTTCRMLMKEDFSNYDLSALRYCTIAGEALNPDVYNEWLRRTGVKLMSGFGQTETTVVIADLPGTEPKVGAMGKPMPHYDVDLVDGEGKPVPPGITGEIIIRLDKGRPEGLFKGYYRDEEKTNEAIHDGAYHTGDTAWRDEDGYLWFVGRNDDVIKSSGYRIGPFEIESVLQLHEAVAECAVTGVPDELRGNLVKATIVLKPGFEPSDELVKELQVFVKKETAPYKYPRVVEFVKELPRTVNGKVRRAAIRETDSQK